jgi:hypothetical protein
MNVQFNEKQTKALKEMAADLGVTEAEVIRRGLALMQIATREVKSGSKLVVLKDKNAIKEIVGIE